MTPHVFVTCGDLTTLACDAWLVPTDQALNVEGPWLAAASRPAAPPEGWSRSGLRAFAENGVSPDARLRVWTNTGADRGEGVAWFVEGARQFVHVAADAIRRKTADRPAPTQFGRERPLVALPLIGTGSGGGADRIGGVVRALLPVLEDVAAATGLDVCLVTRTDRAHAAAQAVRRSRETTTFVANLTPEHLSNGKVLARRAVDGELVLFIGAGVGAGAGLPTWGELLTRLPKSVDFTEAELAELSGMHTLDRGRLIQARCERRQRKLSDLVCAEISSPWRSLSHTLLASLPVNEVASTNYDQLFELAAEDTGRPTAVLPYAPSRELSRWVLKLHGCVTHPDDIVLTRDDYLRFAERRAALAGVVQALLVTRHMLFVGFSLTDDNFHRIVHDVRQALGHSKGEESRFGTALLLDSGPLVAELWQGDLKVVSMAAGEKLPVSTVARRVEILLDYIGMLAADGASHLLDEAFEGALTDAERRMVEELRSLRSRIPTDSWETPAGRKLRTLLRSWGMR